MMTHVDAFQTLADPTRRRIVEALRSGEQQVGDVVEKAGIHQSGVSRHLRILHEAGFVSMRPDGQRRLYSLEPEPFRELDAWLAQLPQAVGSAPRPLRSRAREATQASQSQAQGATHMSDKSKAQPSARRPRSSSSARTGRGSRNVWELWTTKEGFESWWGPEGFRVEVHELEARVGGALHYDMIADSPEMIAAMKQMGQPTSHATRGPFTEVKPHRAARRSRTSSTSCPGVTPYESTIAVEFFPSGDSVRMVVTLDPMHNDEFTKMQKRASRASSPSSTSGSQVRPGSGRAIFCLTTGQGPHRPIIACDLETVPPPGALSIWRRRAPRNRRNGG